MKTTTRRPIIRPNQRKPYFKATQAKIDQRIGFIARMLAAGATKFQIHRAVKQNFNREWRQTDRNIAWLMRGRATPSQKLPSPPPSLFPHPLW